MVEQDIWFAIGVPKMRARLDMWVASCLVDARLSYCSTSTSQP